ncbi:MAG: hypothetical protein ACFCUL_06240, partial [Flavobacteriaceae bacterium]
LIGWSKQQLLPNITFNNVNIQYCQGEQARQKLIDYFGWTIFDGGRAEGCANQVESFADLIDATFLQGSTNPSPTGPILRAEQNNREIYLKFNLSPSTGPITAAQLQMQVSSDPGSGTLQVF